jgi:Zn-dependent protease/predicted transcriptional regulator
MFGKRFKLFRLFGFEVRIDLIWLILGFLITWSLARGLFPLQYKNLPSATYWWMGVAGAIGLFASIVFHELCHSLVAKRFGLPMRGITLFIFGGVAEMEDEPPSAKAEFLMAIAGPLSSILLGLVLYAANSGELPAPVYGVIDYLAAINLILAGFNLLPAYPLDGGRILRSILWRRKKNIRWATRIASQIGAGFGLALVFFGVFSVFLGNIIGGIWQVMIGMFLRGAAQSSYQQVLIRKALEGERVGHLMKKEPVTAPPSLSLQDLVEDYIYTYHHKMYPVVHGNTLVGCVTTRQVKDIPRGEWGRRTVGEIAIGCSPENTVGPDIDAIKALGVMSRTGNSRLMVVENGRLIGVITLKDIMGFLSVRLDLGDEGE